MAKHVELPPRARRIHDTVEPEQLQSGTTSACAENTLVAAGHWAFPWNYLRVRGEYPWNIPPAIYWPELPPRARRIHGYETAPDLANGTTSACAENTKEEYTFKTVLWELPPRARRIPFPVAQVLVEHWNYLRVRGEYIPVEHNTNLLVELPPRARRILEISLRVGE